MSDLCYSMEMKPTLVVFFGAGASIELNISSTSFLTDTIYRELEKMENAQIGNFVVRPAPGEKLPSACLREALDKAYGVVNNYEYLLHAFEAISGLKQSWNNHSATSENIIEAVLSGGPSPNLVPVYNDLWVLAAKDRLFQVIHESMLAACSNITKQANWSTIRDFLKDLESQFDLYVVTTNYDTVVEQALNWSGNEQGFKIIPGEVYGRFMAHDAPPHLLHLHGSICFGYRDSQDANKFKYEDDWNDLYHCETAAGASSPYTWMRSSQASQSGRRTIIGPIISGLQKTDKLLVEPYISYRRHFENLIANTPRLLVAGYGFLDLHINAVLSRMTSWHGSNRKIAVIDFMDDKSWEGSPEIRWSLQRHNFKDTVMKWSKDDSALCKYGLRDPFPDPYMPPGTEAAHVRVFLNGLSDAINHHGAEIIAFLK